MTLKEVRESFAKADVNHSDGLSVDEAAFGGLDAAAFAAGDANSDSKLSLEEFALRYHIPVETVRGWERGTIEPDVVALAYLNVIAADPEGVAKTLEVRGSPLAAE